MKKFSATHACKTTTSALLMLLSFSSASFAQQYCQPGARQPCYQPSLGQMYRTGYDANVQWPRIFIPPARRSVCKTFNTMVNNGWRRQNLLGDYHFSKDTNALTDAGKLKVNWILSQAPVKHRNVFVQRGSEEVQTTARIAAVQEFAGNMSPQVGRIDVSDTHLVAEGHSAGSVDSVFTGYQANRMPPVLPASTGGASTGQ